MVCMSVHARVCACMGGGRAGDGDSGGLDGLATGSFIQ